MLTLSMYFNQFSFLGTVFYKFTPLTNEPNKASFYSAIIISILLVLFVLASFGVAIYITRSPILYAKFRSWFDFRVVKSELLDENEDTHQSEVY